MKINVYDSETSGLPLFNDPSEDPRQPHICEFAILTFDSETRALENKFHCLVKQTFDVDPKAFEAHGITKERSMAEGIDEADAMAQIYAILSKGDLRVAHNETFDQRIVRIGLHRFPQAFGAPVADVGASADAFKALPAYCTMNTSKAQMKLPATVAMRKSGRGTWFKPPSMAETYRWCFNEDFADAHSALADAWACARVYFWMTKQHDIGVLSS